MNEVMSMMLKKKIFMTLAKDRKILFKKNYCSCNEGFVLGEKDGAQVQIQPGW